MSSKPELHRPADTPETRDTELAAEPAAQSPLALAQRVYGVYAWCAFGFCAVFALLAVMLLPGVARRRYWVTRVAQLPFRLAGVRVSVMNPENLPESACVVVANHASYVDGVVLQAFLPPRFSYVIKGEMGRIPVISFLLRRIGAHFVDRHSVERSARDARNILRAADNGDSLAFFPEGTFLPTPGLGRFRGGAFAAAVRSSAPIVPIAIHGTRRLLPANRLLPRRHPLRLDILPPISPRAADDTGTLAELARQSILTVLDEPDLLAAGRP